MNALQSYLDHGFHEVNGWLSEVALEATLLLGEIQHELGVSGPVCEIGVWQGRYLLPLSFVADENARTVGIDPFVHTPDPAAQRHQLDANIARFARNPDSVRIIAKSSREVTASKIIDEMGGYAQMVSVDGDHTMEGALADLRLAETLLMRGGVISVDDFENNSCPGVIEAVIRHGVDPLSRTAPFLCIGNKLFLAHREWCDSYREAILEKCATGGAGKWGTDILNYRDHMTRLKIPVQLLGQELLIPVSV